MSRVGTPLAAVVLLAAAAAAQDAPGPPPVLSIAREEIKPGQMGPHEKQAARFLAVQGKANAKAFRIGLVPVSGDDNQVVYLEGHPSFAEMEAGQNEFEAAVAASPALSAEMSQIEAGGAAMHASQKRMLAVLRSDLSFRPHRMDEVAKARYVTISRTQVRPGRGPDYVDWIKQLNGAREKANADWVRTVVYQVVSGAPAGTYLTFTANRSLAEWDEATAKLEERAKLIEAALGGDEVVKQRRLALADIVAETVPSLYAMHPGISRPAEQFAAWDQAFWKPQPAAASAKQLAVKKEPKN
ncbi:MAG TPA: hypothetical protein VII13_02360 [Vicinamibacteria bacterium]|jgi:hypothetical protein